MRPSYGGENDRCSSKSVNDIPFQALYYQKPAGSAQRLRTFLR
jgi:hypothetical protein